MKAEPHLGIREVDEIGSMRPLSALEDEEISW